MPDPTNTNSNQNQQQDINPPTVTPVIPPTDLPPFPPATTTPTLNNDIGSSAPPPNFPDLNVEEPKKKFGGGKGKIIATILGILMLVGGVGAGAYLTLQNQNINEQAAGAECRAGSSCGNGYEGASGCTGCKSNQVCCKSKSSGGTTVSGCAAQTTQKACNSSCANDNQCKWIDGTCKKSENACGEGGGNVGGGESEIVSCSTDGAFPCGKTPDGKCGGFCITGKTKTCDEMLKQECNFDPVRGANYKEVPLGASCPAGYQSAECNCYGLKGVKTCFDRGFSSQCTGTDGLCALYVDSEASGGTGGEACGLKNTYYCPNVDYTKTGQACSQNANKKPANFCGTIQTDTACEGFKSTYVPCTTSKPNPTATPKPTPSPSPKPTPSPSPSPMPVAQCVNVTAYSSTWTALSPAQLAQLKSGNTVNFCVVGSASAGIFDKAKFTINSSAQAETTTKRPNSQDFCQSYVIPAGTYSFNVTAQIHHATLGWKQ